MDFAGCSHMLIPVPIQFLLGTSCYGNDSACLCTSGQRCQRIQHNECSYTSHIYGDFVDITGFDHLFQ